MLPSPNDLAYFIEVAETQNISRASERLGISQPSVSLAIRRLEDELGVPILYRSKKGVQLTSAGKRLLLQARRLREEWKRVRTGAVNSFTQVEGYYRIGCHTSVALYSLDRFLPTTLCDFPNLEV